ncbi:MAG: ABC transporter permease [Bacteroidales bacterium]|nr:ABC transporter permease [Bacteroidales bacterium]
MTTPQPHTGAPRRRPSSLQAVLLVVQREFMTRVRKKSFIILTILTPFLMAALVFVPFWLATIEDDDIKTVAVHDSTGRYAPLFKDDATWRFVPTNNPDNPAYYTDTTHVEAVVSIRADLAADPKAVTIYSHKEVSAGLLSYVENVLNDKVRRDKLAATGIEGIDQILADVQQDISVQTVKRDAEGTESSSSTAIAIAAGFLLTFFIYMFVMSYGAMVMQSVIEEKTSRIVEVMVSSIKPFQLMMGKIVGISLVGFVQLTIWGVMLAAILGIAAWMFGPDTTAAATQASAMGGMPAVPAAPAAPTEAQQMLTAVLNLPYAELGILFVLYFVGGYLLYAAFLAGVGASVNEQEDASQFMMPVVLCMVFGMYAAMGSAENTNGPLAFWTSMFPLTSPMVMMIRVPFGVPLWQEVLSVALLYATALLCVWGGARIYRVGILMYGKKPTMKEIIKWMRYK